MEHDWLTIHRIKFPTPVDGANNPMPPPTGADLWRFAPEGTPMGEARVRGTVNDAWGGFALYKSEGNARAVFDDPERHLPFMADTVEAWHALVVPYAHRGEAGWRGVVEDGSAIRSAGQDPKGPLVVITSAGYRNPGPEDAERIYQFMIGIDAVLDFYGAHSGNLRRGLYPGTAVDGREGCTISLWKDDPSMMAAAYKAGVHKSQMDLSRNGGLFDYSSFTRGRVVAHKGAWDGVNPIEGVA